ncbi:MAG: ABC transporter permease [Beijerinckiaceae bacterium]
MTSPSTTVPPPAISSGGLAAKLGWLGRHLRKEWRIYVLLAPMIIWFVVFAYKPMIGLQIAFKQYSLFRGVSGSPWVGLENFYTLFNDDAFIRAIRNTFILAGYTLLFAFPAPIILALMFNEVQHQGFKKASQTIVYLPHFISVVIIAGIVISFFSPSTGVVGQAMKMLGYEPLYFLTRPEWFRPIFVGSNIWKEAGFESIVYLAAIAGINPALYESARVDGASRWQMIWRITLPSILPTILIMFIIRIGNVIEVGFEYIILLYQPTTYETADVISTYVYRQGIQGNRYGLAAAAGLFNSVIAFILVFAANVLSKRITRTSLW